MVNARRFMVPAAVLAGLLASGVTAADAPAGRYTPATGTVYDTKTRLTWQKAASTATMPWANAKTYCAGQTGVGWRLPTVKELATIIDFSQTTGPTIDTAFFPGTPADKFWTATPLVAKAGYAWFLDFSFPASGFQDQETSSHWVRCVK